MANENIRHLQSVIVNLQSRRKAYEDGIAEIDAAFAALGIGAPRRKKRGRRPGRPKKRVAAKMGKRRVARKRAKKRAKRRKFKTTANELVLATIKKAGAKGATGVQLTKAWKAARRPGDAYNTLGLLVKAKKIKRRKVKGQRGSVYRVA